MGNKIGAYIINIIFVVLQGSLVLAFTAKKQYFSVVGALSVLLFYLLFMIYENKISTYITAFVRVSVIISLLSNNFLGEYLGLYESSFLFDKILHIFGTFSFSVYIFTIAENKGYLKKLERPIVFILILFLGTFLGTMFEIGEYICDVIFKTKNQGSLADTNLDMICNTLGAALAGFWGISEKKKKTQSND